MPIMDITEVSAILYTVSQCDQFQQEMLLVKPDCMNLESWTHHIAMTEENLQVCIVMWLKKDNNIMAWVIKYEAA